jgi:hypothetical protein
MVIVAKISFPRQHLNRAVAVYTGLPPVPAGIKLSGPYFHPEANLVHAVAIYHLAEESQADGLRLIRDRYQRFQDIPDFVEEILEWHEYWEMLAAWFN